MEQAIALRRVPGPDDHRMHPELAPGRAAREHQDREAAASRLAQIAGECAVAP